MENVVDVSRFVLVSHDRLRIEDSLILSLSIRSGVSFFVKLDFLFAEVVDENLVSVVCLLISPHVQLVRFCKDDSDMG